MRAMKRAIEGTMICAIASPSRVSWTKTVRRSVGWGMRCTRPSFSRPSTRKVTLLEVTCISLAISNWVMRCWEAKWRRRRRA